MKALKVSRDIKPLSEIKAKAGDVVRQVQETGRSVVVTKHGRGVAVLMSVERYERLRDLEQRSELAASLRVAERDVVEGRLASHSDVRARLEGRMARMNGQ